MLRYLSLLVGGGIRKGRCLLYMLHRWKIGKVNGRDPISAYARQYWRKTTLQAAVDHFGADNQLAKLAEEASELSAAILQFLHPAGRDQDQALQNVLEELDDVEICLQQARIIFEHQRPFRAQKLKRLAKRLPEPSIYPGLKVIVEDDETLNTVQDIEDHWVIMDNTTYDLNSYPMRIYKDDNQNSGTL